MHSRKTRNFKILYHYVLGSYDPRPSAEKELSTFKYHMSNKAYKLLPGTLELVPIQTETTQELPGK